MESNSQWAGIFCSFGSSSLSSGPNDITIQALPYLGSKSYGLRLSSFVHCRFAVTVPLYGISMNLQHFGSNIFLFQVIFGALTTLARCLALVVLNYKGRRPTQMLFLFLVGLSILANTFVPQGERRLDFGERKGLSPSFRDCNWSHLSEIRFKDRFIFWAKYSPKPIWWFMRFSVNIFWGKKTKVGEGQIRHIFIFIRSWKCL